MSLKFTSNFQNRLKEALESSKFNSSSLASEIGLSKQALSTYLTGLREPKLPTIKVMAELLNVNEAWLMGADVPRSREDKANVFSASEISIEIAKNIKFYRNENGITQNLLADKLGVKRDTVASWESGETSISNETLIKIAKLLNVSIADLYGKYASIYAIPKQAYKIIKNARFRAGISVNEVISKLSSYGVNVSEKTLYGWESGIMHLDADAFLLLCDIYAVDSIKEEKTRIIQEERFTEPEKAAKVIDIDSFNDNYSTIKIAGFGGKGVQTRRIAKSDEKTLEAIIAAMEAKNHEDD